MLCTKNASNRLQKITFSLKVLSAGNEEMFLHYEKLTAAKGNEGWHDNRRGEG